jgi:hypothetical protein
MSICYGKAQLVPDRRAPDEDAPVVAAGGNLGAVGTEDGGEHLPAAACESPHKPAGCGPTLTQDDITRLRPHLRRRGRRRCGQCNDVDKALLLQAETDPSSPDAAYFETTASP